MSVVKHSEGFRTNKRGRVKSVTWAARDQICQVGSRSCLYRCFVSILFFSVEVAFNGFLSVGDDNRSEGL